MPRTHFSVAVALSCLSAAACFGDNSSQPLPPAGGLEVTLDVASEVDGGDAVEVKVALRGEVGDEVAVELGSVVGALTPAVRSVLIDAAGQGAFVATYQSQNASSPVTLRASAVGLADRSDTAEAKLTVFETERVGTLVPVTTTVPEVANYLVAYPITVVSGGTLRRFSIVAPMVDGATSSARVGLYSSSTSNAPQNALVRLTAQIQPGPNDVPSEPIALAPGKYWMLVGYQGTPITARGPSIGISSGWVLNDFDYAAGLPEVMPAMSVANLGQRNFSIVIRK